MDPVSQKMLDVLEPEMPYKEKASGYTKFGEWYEKNVDDSYSFENAAWCDMVLAWAADKAGVADYAGQFAYTPSHANWFKDKDAWTTKPEPGAIVFYNWNGNSIDGISHVGIVTKVVGNTLHTVEGNADGAYLKKMTRDAGSAVGYGLPGKVEVDGATFAEAQEAKEPEPPAATEAAALSLKPASLRTPAGDAPVEPLAAAATAAVAGALALALVQRRVFAPARGRHRGARS